MLGLGNMTTQTQDITSLKDRSVISTWSMLVLKRTMYDPQWPLLNLTHINTGSVCNKIVDMLDNVHDHKIDLDVWLKHGSLKMMLWPGMNWKLRVTFFLTVPGKVNVAVVELARYLWTMLELLWLIVVKRTHLSFPNGCINCKGIMSSRVSSTDRLILLTNLLKLSVFTSNLPNIYIRVLTAGTKY